MRQPYGPRHTKGQQEKRHLERKVLAHLKKYGASLYDALSICFDLAHTAAIQPVLHGLKAYGYIEVGNDKMVTITTFGLQQLKGKDC